VTQAIVDGGHVSLERYDSWRRDGDRRHRGRIGGVPGPRTTISSTLASAGDHAHNGGVANYDLHSEAYVSDPYGTYRRMAVESPVWLQESTGHVYVSRYADVREVLLNSQDFSNDRVADRLSRIPDHQSAQCLAGVLHDRLVMTDGQRHHVLRDHMRAYFTASRVRSNELMVRDVIVEELERIDWSKPVDFLGEIALPIPSKVILQVLGFPPGDVSQLRRWTSDFYNWLATSPGGIEERTQRALEATTHMRAYIAGLMDDPPESAQSSLLGSLLASLTDGELTQTEVVANLIGLVNAAHETTTSLMANTMILLLANPDQLALLSSDPSLIPGAIAEVGRLESPAQIISRMATRDVRLDGVEIRAGQLVAVNLAQANRDPEAYRDPDRFDVTRTTPAPLTYGHGEHVCIGMALAKLESELLLDQLLPRMEGASILDEPIVWRPTPAFRCPQELTIRFTTDSPSR
jgi:cytochrome P450